jgi:hypothetical protein
LFGICGGLEAEGCGGGDFGGLIGEARGSYAHKAGGGAGESQFSGGIGAAEQFAGGVHDGG